MTLHALLPVLVSGLSLAAPATPDPELARLLQGPLTQETLKEVVHAHHAEVRACALARPAAVQKTRGKVVVHFAITPAGSVEDVGTRSATVKEPELERCLHSAIRAWRFPRPKKGRVEVNFPFHVGPPRPLPAEAKPPDPDPAPTPEEELD